MLSTISIVASIFLATLILCLSLLTLFIVIRFYVYGSQVKLHILSAFDSFIAPLTILCFALLGLIYYQSWMIFFKVFSMIILSIVISPAVSVFVINLIKKSNSGK